MNNEQSQDSNLQQLLKSIDFSPLRLESTQQYNSPSIINTHFGINPVILNLKWNERDYSQQILFPFIIEPRAISGQKALLDAMLRIRSLADPPSLFPMIIASHLNPNELDMLKEVQISGFDQSGNCIVIVPVRQLFILKSGQRNKYPEKRQTKNVYSGITSLVARTFLVRKQFDTVSDIKGEIKKRGAEIALSTVSKALNGLRRDLMITQGAPVRVTQPKRLLELLKENYRKPEPVKRVMGRIEGDPHERFRMMHARAYQKDELIAVNSPSKYTALPDTENKSYVFDSPSQYTIFPGSNDIVRIYVSSVDKLLPYSEDFGFKETTRFPNVELIEFDDPIVFFDYRFEYVSPIQIYLELATGGKREREAAEQMVDDIVNYRYGNR